MGDSDTPAVDPSRPEYVYVQVADHIAGQIASGRLAAGAMLPGERALAEEYGVALNTVRGAVALLRERGLVVTLPAKGTYVRDVTEG
jgi:GntR family transcriptional regulator